MEQYGASTLKILPIQYQKRLSIDRINHPSGDMNFMRVSIIANCQMLCVRGM